MEIIESIVHSLIEKFVQVTTICTPSYQATAYPQQYQSGNHTFGIISGIQNDKSGQPAWIVSGHWTSIMERRCYQCIAYIKLWLIHSIILFTL